MKTQEDQHGCYSVMPRYRNYKIYSNGEIRNLKNKLLKTINSSSVTLYPATGQRESRLIKELILEAFGRHKKDGEKIIHIDNNKYNLRLDNLEYEYEGCNCEHRKHPTLTEYEISSCGKILSSKCQPRVYLHPGRDTNGYENVYINGKMYLVHRLVLETFKRFKSNKNEVCRHLDGDITNNDMNNLVWGNQKQNAADRAIHGTETQGVDVWCSKLNDDKVRAIRNSDKTTIELGKIYGVDSSQISRIKNRLIWKHVI